uniref:F-box domain-containing protein n=1 Tax=Davidia involucrata TaxID=16924 RepID=A0A5B7A288_DAVIN
MADCDWSRLPYDLIATIANRLTVIEDFLAFSGVCRSWRSVFWNRNWTPGPQFPWLMLSENRNETTRSFFSFFKNKRLVSSLPEARGRRCWGSACGWLITIGVDLEIHLLNPITQICIDLPPQSTFGNQPPDLVGNDVTHNWYQTSFINRAFVLKSSSQDAFMVMAIHGSDNSLAFARPGYDSWATVEISSPYVFRDVTLFEGQIFAICNAGTLVAVEIDGSGPHRAIHIASQPSDHWPWHKIYLVESLGDLLLLFRCATRSVRDFSMETISFEVYKFDFSTKEWMKLDDLGDRALFVGDNCSMSLSTSQVLNCKSNSIYFTDDNVEWWPKCEEEQHGRFDMGVYNMADRSIESLHFGDNFPLHYSCPIWVMPAIC